MLWWLFAGWGQQPTVGTERNKIMEERLTGRCGMSYLPGGWQTAHCTEMPQNANVALDQINKAMIITTGEGQIKFIWCLKGFAILFRKSNWMFPISLQIKRSDFKTFCVICFSASAFVKALLWLLSTSIWQRWEGTFHSFSFPMMDSIIVSTSLII